MMPHELLNLTEREGIIVEFVELPEKFLGLYDSRPREDPVILLANELKGDRKLLRCVLAEELGHYYTTGINLLLFARREKLIITQGYESLALWWATKFLVPLDRLSNRVNRGCHLTHELAEYFDVTCRFMGTAVKLYNEKMPIEMLKYFRYRLNDKGNGDYMHNKYPIKG